MTWHLRAPVAFLIFNRPEKTKRVFAEIAKARPSRLFIIADGPRPDRPSDAEKVRLTRAIVEKVDWGCEVLRNYSDVNLGMNPRTVTGLDWVFGTVQETIFLEDDCLPDPSFFPFCSELLERYRNDERVMMISGDNYMRGRRVTPDSYFFSHYTGTWGWATWRRAWQHLDINMEFWPTLRQGALLEEMLGNKTYAAFWRHALDRVALGYVSSWDLNWLFTCWTQKGLSVMPSTNLISNIGFGPDATNLVDFNSTIANLPTTEILFPLQHPSCMTRNREVDEFLSRRVFRCGRWINHLRRFFPNVGLSKGKLAARSQTRWIDSNENDGT
jgi:hypothetical protein